MYLTFYTRKWVSFFVNCVDLWSSGWRITLYSIFKLHIDGFDWIYIAAARQCGRQAWFVAIDCRWRRNKAVFLSCRLPLLIYNLATSGTARLLLLCSNSEPIKVESTQSCSWFSCYLGTRSTGSWSSLLEVWPLFTMQLMP